jgi:hypothetical protein
MSPEYSVNISTKTGKGEIKVDLLPGEDSKDLHEEIIIAYLANSYLKNEEGLNKAKDTLERVLPPEITESFLEALNHKNEEAYVAFKKTAPNKYKIIDTNLNVKKSSDPAPENPDFMP